MGKKTNKIIICFFAFVAAGLWLLAFVVWFFDPFYQYHEPYLGLKPVLYERETQVIGTIRNFDYDSVLAGSSVMENCNTDFLNEAFGCETIKLVKGSGTTADLLYYLEEAHRHQELTHVFYGLDLFALMRPTEVTVVSEYSPKYLYTDMIWDDFSYLFNKDVLLEKIPLMIAYSKQEKYIGGEAYSWDEGKEFGIEKAKQAYAGPGEWQAEQDYSEDISMIQENIGLLCAEVEAHPQTRYVFMLPPYSLLYWDEVTRAGDLPVYLYTLEEVLKRLTKYENVEIYNFMSEKDIVCDLNFYMDKMHYTTQINQFMLQCILDGSENYRVSAQNWQNAVRALRETCMDISGEDIYRYYEDTGLAGGN